MAGLPQLVKLQDELKETGFSVVAIHCQDVPQDKVTKLLKQHKAGFTVTSGGNIPDNPVSGIPAAFLFDSSGNLVERGHPSTMKGSIQALVEKEPHFLAAGRKYTKLAAAAESLKKTRAYGQVLKSVEKHLKTEGAPGEEAKYLSERITAYGEKLLAAAKEREGVDAFKAQQSYVEISANWKGTPIGEKAAARIKELKADKEFQDEHKAAAVAAQILAECDKLVWQGRGELNLESPANKKVVTTVTASAQAFKKKFSKSKAATRLDAELASYGLKKT